MTRVRFVRPMLLLLLPALAGCAGNVSSRQSAQTAQSGLGLRVADAMLTAGDARAALHVADGLLANDPHDMQARLRRSRALIALDRSGEAAADMEDAAEQSPRDAGLWEALAVARAASGDSLAAEHAWREVLRQRPADTRAMTGLAVALDLQENHAQAQRLYQNILRLRPDDRRAAANYGLSLALSGRPREALVLLQRPGVAGQGPRARHDLAVALVLAGDEAGARATLSEDMGEAEIAAAIIGIKALSRS